MPRWILKAIKNGIKSFPSRFSPPVTFTAILVSIPIWAAAFSILSSLGEFILSVIFVVGVLVAGGNDFQNWWFVHMQPLAGYY